MAAIDLKDKDLRIIDVAVKYGYNSADSFSRAFHSLHGILPSEARSENTQLKAISDEEPMGIISASTNFQKEEWKKGTIVIHNL